MKHFLSIIFILGMVACSKQVKKTHVETKVETPVVQEPPAKPKSKLEKKRDKINRVVIGKTIPDGSVVAMDESIVSTIDYRGKLLIIDFWATWCGPCLQGAPKFKELAKKYESDKVAFISVSIDRDYDDWKSFLIRQAWSSDTQFWMGMDKTNPLFSFLYKEVDDEGHPLVIIGVPKYVLISPEGEILDNEAEFPTNPTFEKHIKQLVKVYE